MYYHGNFRAEKNGSQDVVFADGSENRKKVTLQHPMTKVATSDDKGCNIR